MKKLMALLAACAMLLASCSADSGDSSANGGNSSAQESSSAADPSSSEETSSEAPEEKTPRSIKVMPYGDSITDGFWLPGGYRITLCNMLEGNGLSQYVDFVGRKNSGDCYDGDHNGYTAYAIDRIGASDSVTGTRSGLLKDVDTLMEKYPCDVVMLQIGTNDILSLYDLDNIGERLETLVDKVLSHLPEDGMLYLATITCMDATDNTYIPAEYFTVEEMDGYVDSYNQVIKDLVEKKKSEGANIELADVGSVITKDDLYDGVHPNEEGYKKIGEFWYEIIKDIVGAE